MANAQFPETTAAVRALNAILRELAETAERLSTSNRELASTTNDITTRANANRVATEQLTRAQRAENEITRLGTEAGRQEIDAQVRLTETRRLAREAARANNNITNQSASFTQRLTAAYTKSIIKIAAFAAGIKAAYAAVKGFITGAIEAAKQTTAVAQTFNLSREEASGLTKQVRSLSAAFDEEFNDVLKSSKIIASEFGISGKQALDLIESGFIRGANVNGEFLELLKEYPAQLKSVGLSAKQSIALITQTEQKGLFSDKGIDAIKEAGIRLRELSPATIAALEGIGLSGATIQEELRTGAKSLFEITQQVSGKLSELPPQSKEVGAAIADIFGGAGEDAGLNFLTTLNDIDLELDNIEVSLSDVEIASIDLKSAWSEMGSAIKDTSAYKTAVKGLTNVLNLIKSVAQGVDGSISSDYADMWENRANELLKNKEAYLVLLDLQDDLAKSEEEIAKNIKISEENSSSRYRSEAKARIELQKIEQAAIIAQIERVKEERDAQNAASIQRIRDEEIVAAKRKEIEDKSAADRIAKAKRDEEKLAADLWKIQFKAGQKKTALLLANNDKDSENYMASLDADNEFFNEFLDKQNEYSIDKLKEQLDAEAELKLKSNMKDIDREVTKQEILAEIKEAAFNAAEKIITDSVTSGLDDRLNETLSSLDSEQELLQNKLDKELISESEFTKKSLAIDKKRKYEEAKAEKKKALFEIGISTLVEVAKAGFISPQALIVAIAGAASAIAVAAKPLPAFFKGVQNFEGGLAYTGEEGSELIEIPGKEPILSPDTKTKMFLPAGTNVIPHEKTKKILEDSKNSNLELKVLKSIDNKLDKQIVTNETNITRGGYEFIVKTANERRKYIDKHFG